MNIRRVLLDVDNAIQRPEIIDIAKAIDAAPGVAGLNITVTEIDMETVGIDITVEEVMVTLSYSKNSRNNTASAAAPAAVWFVDEPANTVVAASASRVTTRNTVSGYSSGNRRNGTKRAMLDVPGELILFVSRLLADHRRQIGTRKGNPG